MDSHVSRPYLGFEDSRKFCLKFCYNLFPKEYEFHKDDIVQLWLSQEITTLFASIEFERLLKRQFFQKSTAGSRYTLNNSIFDSLQEQIDDTYFRSVDDDNSCISDNTLHCSLGGAFTFEELYVAESLQTLLILHTGRYLLNQVPRELFLKLPLLRALDLSYTSITELPSSIGNLKDLRYLNLSGTPITSLPDSLCYLSEMQTLKLKDCVKFLGLPEDTRKLRNLWYLDVDVACLLLWMPPSLGDLRALRKLPAFVVGKENGCRITELKDLAMLSGELEILRLENVSSLDEAKEAALYKKWLIKKLKLQWTELRDGFTVLETLRPHENLEELDIVGYGGVKFPSWIGIPIFYCLTVLNIHDCARCKLIPPLGKLLSLRSLSISGMHSVKEITGGFCGREMVGGTLENFIREKVSHTSRSDNKFVAFPQLRSLILDRMQRLEKWSGMEEGDFPSLQELNISGCPKLIALPTVSVMKTLRQLEISLCPLIESFPKGGMPTSLHCLVVVDCPLLKKQCLAINGQESGMLAHIDSVWIDYEQVPNMKSRRDQSQLSVNVMKSQTKAIDVSPWTPDVSREDMPDSSVKTKYADYDVSNLNSFFVRRKMGIDDYVRFICYYNGQLLDEDMNPKYIMGQKKFARVPKSIGFTSFKQKIQEMTELPMNGTKFQIKCAVKCDEFTDTAVDVDDDVSLQFVMEHSSLIKAYILRNKDVLPATPSTAAQR